MQRAIETRYKQRLFRSRLEARYAVFFDALEIKWDYEPEAFDLGHGLWYLPDFFLHGVGTYKGSAWGYWVEIKGTDPTDAEKYKFDLLCKQTGHSGYIFVGSPGEGRVFRCDRDDPWRPRKGVVLVGPSVSDTRGPLFQLAWSAAVSCCSPVFGRGYDKKVDVAVGRALSMRFDPKGQARA